MLEVTNFFNLKTTKYGAFITMYRMPWDVIRAISAQTNMLVSTTQHRNKQAKIHPRALIEGDVFIGAGSEIDANAIIRGPAYIGKRCRIGANAWIRPNTIIADGSTVGYNCEVKNSLILEGTTVSHFCFIGDSIVGQNVNLGSNTTTANFPHKMPLIDDGSRIVMNYGEYGRFMVGLRHLGATIGDGCRLGCHTVLNPGTLVGMNVITHPNLVLSRYIPEKSVVKQTTHIRLMPEKVLPSADLPQTFTLH